MPTQPTLYYNANIVTLDGQMPRARAMLVENGIVQSIGPEEGLGTLSDWIKVDLEGATVVPGFNDCHMHVLSMGLGLRQVDVRPNAAPSIRAVAAAVGGRVSGATPGHWVLGRGYNQNLLAERRHPNRFDLDSASAGHPVVLWHTSGHVLVANSAALAAAGVTSGTPDPEGGQIERDGNGEPTGVLKENAMRLIRAAIPAITPDIGREAILAASGVLASEGITSATDAATGQNLPLAAEAAIYRAALESGDLKTRLALMPVIEQVVDGSGTGPQEFNFGARPRWLNARHAKVFTDGALTTRTAALRGPYADGSGDGILTWADDDLAAACSKAASDGWWLACHAIGDRAIDQVLEVLTALQLDRSARSRIEHATICDRSQIGEMGRLGVTVVLQPEDIAVLGDAYPPGLGSDRAENNSPVGWFRDESLTIAFSSDRPVTPGNPLAGVRAAVERMSPSGVDLGSRAHAISAETAVLYYTHGAARASGDEDWKGRLVPGQAGDFAVLDRDITVCPPDEIDGARVLRTVVDGETVFQGYGSVP